jgi:CRP/FNR family transcriptional regulator, cyclic AMP receptor protein
MPEYYPAGTIHTIRSGKETPLNPPSPAQLSALPDGAVRQLAAHGQIRSFRKNAVVINEGEAGDSLYVILSGRVKIFVADGEGREMILDTLGPGDVVGEMTLDGGPRSASVICTEAATFSMLTRAVLREAIVASPDFALQLISTLICRMRQATDLVKGLALLDVYGRVAGLLLKLAVEQDGRLVIPERLTQQDIADRVGASRDMVNRIFKELTAGGYLSVENRQIVLNRKPPARW